MKLIVAGPINGKIRLLYQECLKQNWNPDWLLCTGNWGTWPDHAKLDRPTKQREETGDFAKLYLSNWQAPIQTLYVSGVHEDHKWLANRLQIGNMETLPNVHWLANGYKTNIGDGEDRLRITGFGKVYSQNTFLGQYSKKSKRHYTRSEFEKACSSGPTDILLLYETPENEYTRKIIFATRPSLIAHHSNKLFEPYEIMDIPVVPLTKGHYNLITYTKINGFQIR